MPFHRTVLTAACSTATRTRHRLVDYVKDHLVVVPIDEVGDLIKAGAIHVDGRSGRMAERVDDGARISVENLPASALLPEDLALAIRHEDEDFVIVDKPAAVHVHPNGPHRQGTLLNALLWHCGARPDDPWGEWRPRPLHRLDRAASGLVAFAKTAAIHDHVRRLFADGRIHRVYRALVHGAPAADAGTIDAPLGRDPAFDYRRAVVPDGQHAVTHWTVVERAADRTLLELTLETGRTHQIRAHLASVGHPIVGDTLYMDGPASTQIELYAVQLRVPHPRTGETLVVTR